MKCLPVCLLLLTVLLGGRARADEPPSTTRLPAVIDELEINGLWRTKRYIVERELPYKAGQTVTVEDWELGLARLANMGVFSRVAGRLEQREEKLVAVFDLEERWTIILILRTGGGGGAAWFQTGLSDINTLGRFVETGALYERFDRYNGFQVWAKHPRLFDERQELHVIADRMVRPRPGFALLRTGVHLEYSRQLTDSLITGGKLEWFHDHFDPPFEGEARTPVDSQSVFATYWLRVGRVDVKRLLHDGWLLDVKPSLGVTNAPGRFGFGQLLVEAQKFHILNSRLLVGGRVRVAASTDAQEQHRYYLGGLDTVRGYPDNHVRTDLFAFANLEARFVAFDSTWLAIMPTLFVDAAAARDDRAGPLGLLSAGAGVRILFPRLYRSGARIDFPVPLTPLGKPTLAFGVYQFFGN